MIEVGDYVSTPSGFRGTVTQVNAPEQLAIVQRPELSFGVSYDFDELEVLCECPADS